MRGFFLAFTFLSTLLLSTHSWAQEEKETPSLKTKEAIEKFKRAPEVAEKGLEALKEAAKAKLQETLGTKAPDTEKAKQSTLITEALELSGAKKQIEQLATVLRVQYQTQLTKRQGAIDPKEFARVQGIFKESFGEAYRAEALYQSVESSLVNKYDEKRLLATLQWFRSPLGKKISQLEVRSSAPEASQEIAKFTAELKKKPAGKGRLALVQRLDKATSATEFPVQTNLDSFRSLMKAVDAIVPPEKRLKEGQLEKLVNDMRGELQTPLRETTLVNMLFTYRTLQDDELRQYVEFAESDSGRWFATASVDGLKSALAAASEKAYNKIFSQIKGSTDPLAPPTKKSEQFEPSPYSSVGKRDPFRPLAMKSKVSTRLRENLSPLERYEIGQLKLVAIIWDVKEPRAMVEDASGLGYVVKVGTPIGPNAGKVKAIKPTEIVIEESYVDFFGARKNQEISMRLPED
jgi:type IV pilus assembly protein PilP